MCPVLWLRKGKAPLSRGDATTLRKTKDPPFSSHKALSGSCSEWPSARGNRSSEPITGIAGKNPGLCIRMSLRGAQGQCLPTQLHLCRVKKSTVWRQKGVYVDGGCTLLSRGQGMTPRTSRRRLTSNPEEGAPLPVTLLGNCSSYTRTI